jgi:hypothetical protein
MLRTLRVIAPDVVGKTPLTCPSLLTVSVFAEPPEQTNFPDPSAKAGQNALFSADT